MNNLNKIIFNIRPTAYRAWNGNKMLDIQTLCWNAMGAIWYAQNNQFGWAWVNPGFTGWEENNKKPAAGDICPIMQWTGLRDKDGKDIYEGDIVYDETNVSMKQYQIVSFDFGMWTVSDVTYFAQLDRFDQIKVVGNIFETPGLIS